MDNRENYYRPICESEVEKMRKYKYSMSALLSNISISLLIILEIYILFVAANLSIASINSRDMLYSPVKDKLEKNGFFYLTNDKDSVKDVNSVLESDVSITEVKQYTDRKISYRILPDEIFDKLDLPIKSGEKFKSSSSEGLPKLIVSSNDKGVNTGDILSDTMGNEYEIAATLTDKSYMMSFSAWSIDMTYEDLYTTLDIKYDDHPSFYTCESQVKNLNISNNLIGRYGVIVNYESSVPQEQIQDDMKKLSPYGLTASCEDIARRSNQLLSDDIKKLVPPVGAFGIIVLIGIISCAVINSKNMTYKLSVMYCCGASKKDCIKINSVAMLILLFIGLAASIVTVVFLDGSFIADNYGFIFNKNNIYITAVITLLFTLISIVVPSFLLSKNKSYESLKNERMDEE